MRLLEPLMVFGLVKNAILVATGEPEVATPPPEPPPDGQVLVAKVPEALEIITQGLPVDPKVGI